MKDLQVLRRDKWLCSHGPYYVPTEKLCLKKGIHRKYGQTKGELTIAKRVAVAAYCIQYGLERYSPYSGPRFSDHSVSYP